MTRKDYIVLANIIRAQVNAGAMNAANVYVFAANLDAQYPNFNRDRFEAACLGNEVT